MHSCSLGVRVGAKVSNLFHSHTMLSLTDVLLCCVLPAFTAACLHSCAVLCYACLRRLCALLQSACEGWQEGVESLRKDMAAGQNPSPDRVRDLLLSAAATGAALGHMDDLQVSFAPLGHNMI